MSDQPITKKDLDESLNKVVKEIGGVINDLATQIGRDFRGVDEKFKNVDNQFKKIDDRFDQVDGRLDRMERKLDQTIDRVDDHSMRLTRLEEKAA